MKLKITHPELVVATKKPAETLLKAFTAKQADLIHMILGISGEAGELLDTVKKHAVYQKELDITNIMEELGDIEYYLEGFRQILGINREEVLAGNIEKLRARYESVTGELAYSDDAAIARADKAAEGTPPIVAGTKSVSRNLIDFSEHTLAEVMTMEDFQVTMTASGIDYIDTAQLQAANLTFIGDIVAHKVMVEVPMGYRFISVVHAISNDVYYTFCKE
jgi:NTP pyrophosphatase (non-canonical NTP hydrolase)